MGTAVGLAGKEKQQPSKLFANPTPNEYKLHSARPLSTKWDHRDLHD